MDIGTSLLLSDEFISWGATWSDGGDSTDDIAALLTFDAAWLSKLSINGPSL
jgi:hypothetical protein